jgi:hypothetical protein
MCRHQPVSFYNGINKRAIVMEDGIVYKQSLMKGHVPMR